VAIHGDRRRRAHAFCLALLGVVSCALTSDDARAARKQCVSIITDTIPLQVDTFALFGESTEGAEVIVERLAMRRERLHVTYFGEQGRVRQWFSFADGALVCAEERPESYDRPLSGVVVDSTPTAVTFSGAGPAWFWLPTAADTAAGRIDSLPAISARLRAQAESLRVWVQRQPNMQATRTP
jgi:hypothetical protein